VAETYPTVEATVRAFEAAGFAFQALQPVPQVTAPSLRAAVERVRLRADTTLQALGDGELAAGLAAMERAAAAETTPPPSSTTWIYSWSAESPPVVVISARLSCPCGGARSPHGPPKSACAMVTVIRSGSAGPRGSRCGRR
jgi:hypothetical protein